MGAARGAFAGAPSGILARRGRAWGSAGRAAATAPGIRFTRITLKYMQSGRAGPGGRGARRRAPRNRVTRVRNR